ncbi:MAG TPA: MarR family transcriptional regulator [Acidimicrobiaceae bacterium]|nr:MarR family transcriptional regulator [Acidimicrobiaceae bacterium]
MSKNDAGVRAVARLGRVFEKRLGDEGMSLPQFRVLAFLSEGEWAASKVAEWLAVSRPSLTSLVDGLVEQGWVERREHPTDRRSVLHFLTDAGRTRLAEATEMLSEGLDGLLEHLDDDERARAEDGLALLQTAMHRHYEAMVTS